MPKSVAKSVIFNYKNKSKYVITAVLHTSRALKDTKRTRHGPSEGLSVFGRNKSRLE